MGRPGRPRGSGSRRDRSLRTVDRKPIRPLERQRMRPWLMQLLEGGDCHQIAWMNKREKTFRMAWKHAAGQNWDRGQDCNIFELWARHTGKYYDGDKPDHKKWKANFRCALNSLLDVEEMKDQGVRRGNNAFRVYKFLDEKRPRKAEIKVEPMDEEEAYVYRSPGTKSRPRKPIATQYDLDSEGSELGNSMENDYSNSDIVEEEYNKKVTEHSPLPHFDQICPLVSQIDINSSISPARFPEASSPQTHSSSSDDDGDSHSTTSSAPTDDEVILMLLEPGEVEPGDFWQNYTGIEDSFMDIPIQEGPEEIISEDGKILTTLVGPNVIVEEAEESPDFAYTSLGL